MTNDISPDYLAELKQSYYVTKVVVTQEETVNIEIHTVQLRLRVTVADTPSGYI